jgi:membrane protease YdiL (CAAX protease family)
MGSQYPSGVERKSKIMNNLIKKYPLPAFFLLAFSLTWIGSTVYYFAVPQSSQVLPAFLSTPSFLFWYYGPCLSAIIVTWITGGKGGVCRLLKRLLDWHANWKWYVFIVLYPLALHLAVVYLDQLLGGPVPLFFHAEGVLAGNTWVVLIGLILFQVFVRGIGEETGWRGFALPNLQSHRNGLTASLLLGVLWGLWHFHPANHALLSISGIFLFINILLTTPVITWVYNHTRGSIFMAAMFHMTLNVVEFVVPIGMTGAGLTRNLLQVAVLLATLAVLLLVSGPQLGRDTAEAKGR